jgi:hypothetical protein
LPLASSKNKERKADTERKKDRMKERKKERKKEKLTQKIDDTKIRDFGMQICR